MKTKMTDQEWEKIDGQLELLYGDNGMPEYLQIVDKDTIKIKAGRYEGDRVNWIVIKVKDVINYYRQDNSMGCASFSGCRNLANFTTDWRMVDNMAKECLELFKILNKDALIEEGRKYGMELR